MRDARRGDRFTAEQEREDAIARRLNIVRREIAQSPFSSGPPTELDSNAFPFYVNVDRAKCRRLFGFLDVTSLISRKISMAFGSRFCCLVLCGFV